MLQGGIYFNLYSWVKVTKKETTNFNDIIRIIFLKVWRLMTLSLPERSVVKNQM
jgi:hypothetical protein